MEREPGAQQVEVTTFRPEAGNAPQSVRLALLLFFITLWPWFWVSLGLYVIRDFRVTIALYEILCCVLPVFLFRRERVPVLPLGYSMRLLLALCLVSNLFFLSVFKATNGLTIDWPVFAERARGIHMGMDPTFWGYGAYLVFLNPVFEECFWRGTVYREFRNFLTPWQANLLSSVFFGGWHWLIVRNFCPTFWAVFCTAVVILGGIIFAWTYERSGTLGASILMHGLGADFPILFILHTALTYSGA